MYANSKIRARIFGPPFTCKGQKDWDKRKYDNVHFVHQEVSFFSFLLNPQSFRQKSFSIVKSKENKACSVLLLFQNSSCIPSKHIPTFQPEMIKISTASPQDLNKLTSKYWSFIICGYLECLLTQFLQEVCGQ